MHTVTGSVRVCVGLARPPLNVKYLQKWSIKELAALNFSYRFTLELAKTYKAARDLVGLTARSGPATHPANRDLEGIRNASPPEICFFKFLILFFKFLIFFTIF